MSRQRSLVALLLTLILAGCGGTPPATTAGSYGRPATPAPSVAPSATESERPSPPPAVAVAPSPTSAPVVASWPMLRGNAARDGHGDKGPVGNPVLQWRFQAQGGVAGPPAVVGDTVYAISDDAILQALDRSTGSEKWQFQGALGGDLGPVVVDGSVFITDAEGVIRAVDATSGTERWHTSAPVPGGFVVADRSVFVASDGALVALDATSGAERWRYTNAGAGAFHKPAYGNGTVYAGSDTGGYVAVDAVTGELRWQADTGTDGTGTAVVADGIAYLGDNGEAKAHLYAFDAADGELLWRLDEPIFSPAVLGGVAFSGGSAGYVSAHDVKSGKLLWKFPVRGEVEPVAVAGGVVYAPGSGESRIYALDAITGAQRWHFDVDGSIGGSLAVTAGVVYAGTAVGGVYAIGGDGSSTIAAQPSATPPATTATSPCPPGPASPTGAALPDGLYRTDPVPVDAIAATLARAGIADPAARVADLGWASAKTVAFSFCAFGGQWHQFERVDDGRDVQGSHGTYVLQGRDSLIETDCCFPEHLTLTYTLEGNVLHITGLSLDSSDPGSQAAVAAIYTSAPFTLVVPRSATPGATLAPSTAAAKAIFASEPAVGLQLPAPTLVSPVAFGPNGLIYTLDLVAHKVLVFDTTGKVVRSWGKPGKGPGEFNFARDPGDINGNAGDVAINSAGDVFVADCVNDRIQKFDSQGTLLLEWGGFGSGDGQFVEPIGVTTDANGHVFVVDDQRDDIQEFDTKGTFIRKFGGHGTGDGQLNFTGYIRTDPDGNVLNADWDNHRVQAFSNDGTFLWTLGTRGTEPGQFLTPFDVAVDAAGNLYVADADGEAIQAFDRNREFLGSWATTGAAEGNGPGRYGVSADGDGRVYATVNAGDRVLLLPSVLEVAAAPAEFVWAATADGLDFPNGLSLDPEGRLWVADTGNSRFAIFTPDGKFVEYWGKKGKGDGEFDLERANGDGYGDIEFAPDGSFYVLDAGNRRIDHFDKDRTFLTSWGGFGTNPGQFVDVIGLVVDAKGIVHALDDGRNVVEKYDANGTVIGSFAPGLSGVNTANAIAVDAAGNVYISFCCSAGNTVRTFDPTGRPLLTIGPAGGGQFPDQPGGLSVDAEHRVFVPLGEEVVVFGRDGAKATSWGNDRLKFPVTVLLDGAGNAYVTDAERNEVIKYRLADDLAAVAFPAAT